MKQLDDADARKRRQAAYALGRIGPAAIEAVPALANLLDDSQPEVGWYAAEALGRMGPAAQPATGELIAALEMPESREVLLIEVARALGELGESDEAAQALAKALQSPETRYRSSRFRVAAAVAWWNLNKAPDALAVINSELKSDGSECLFEAAVAVAQIGPAAVRLTPALVEALKVDNADVRNAAARALGSVGLAPVQSLQEPLNSPRPETRIAVARALGWIADAVRSRVLDDPGATDEQYKQAANQIHRRIVSVLVPLAADEATEVRTAAGLALARCGPPALPALLEALPDDNPAARHTAVTALSRMAPYLPEQGREPAGYLRLRSKLPSRFTAALSQDDTAARRSAFRLWMYLGYEEADDSIVELLRRGLADQDAAIRRYAAEAIGRLEEQK